MHRAPTNWADDRRLPVPSPLSSAVLARFFWYCDFGCRAWHKAVFCLKAHTKYWHDNDLIMLDRRQLDNQILQACLDNADEFV